MRWCRSAPTSHAPRFPLSTTTAISREYLDAVRETGADARPNYSSMEGYLAAKVFAEGLKRAGRNPSRDSLVARVGVDPERELRRLQRQLRPEGPCCVALR